MNKAKETVKVSLEIEHEFYVQVDNPKVDLEFSLNKVLSWSLFETIPGLKSFHVMPDSGHGEPMKFDHYDFPSRAKYEYEVGDMLEQAIRRLTEAKKMWDSRDKEEKEIVVIRN